MKRMLTFLLISICAPAQQDGRVTFLAAQASVQDVVSTIAAQAGLKFDVQDAPDQTNLRNRELVRDIRIVDVPFEAAMHRILDGIGLRYEVTGGVITLFPVPNATTTRAPAASRMITDSTPKKSVQYVVIELAAQAGLGYNWQKSAAQTDPERRKFVFDVSLKGRPFAEAIETILDPVGLRSEIESGEVVLYRK